MFKRLIWIQPLMATACLAQFDASVLGTIIDPTNSVVAGAKVKLDNLQTAVSESAETDTNGIYRFLNVPVGKYKITAQAPGFKIVTTEEFRVAVEARQRVDIKLEVGELTSTVTVSGAAAESTAAECCLAVIVVCEDTPVSGDVDDNDAPFAQRSVRGDKVWRCGNHDECMPPGTLRRVISKDAIMIVPLASAGFHAMMGLLLRGLPFVSSSQYSSQAVAVASG